MAGIMQQLKTDHGNIARLLSTLEEQMDILHAQQSADFDLMHDIMVYMTQYPDHTHHPMEDLMFEKLVVYDSGAIDIVARLKREHEGLAEKGERFLEMLRHVVDGALVEREAIGEAGRNYIAFLRSHMEVEDADAFPRAERTLSDQDWDDVASSMDARADPVFGPVIAEEFRSLYDYIQRES